MSEKPLDLEERKLIEEIILKSGILLKNGNDLVDYEIPKSEIDKLILYAIKEIKQRIKSACEFWLKYKNRPDNLAEEQPQYKEELSKFDYLYRGALLTDLERYNEWLFRLAFKSVLKNERK